MEEEVDLGNTQSEPVPPKKRKLTSSTEPAIDTTTLCSFKKKVLKKA